MQQTKRVKTSPTNSHLWSGKVPANTQVVGINWRDIQYVDNWNEDSEVAPARYLFTIGYLLYQGPDPKDTSNDITVIAGTYDYDNDKWADFTVFPSVVVRKVHPITRKRRA
jgi:hypothetical protein